MIMDTQDRRPTVLVAEDVALVRLNLVQQLEDTGFRVLEARDAESAVTLLEAGEPVRIVLTDLNMPGAMDGLGLLRWVKLNRPEVIRAVATALADKSPTEEVSAPDLVFSKPFDPLRISQKLWDALAR
jgi:two-component system, response regulator PdtaR